MNCGQERKMLKLLEKDTSQCHFVFRYVFKCRQNNTRNKEAEMRILKISVNTQ